MHGLTAILKDAWTTSQHTEDKREKIQAYSVYALREQMQLCQYYTWSVSRSIYIAHLWRLVYKRQIVSVKSHISNIKIIWQRISWHYLLRIRNPRWISMTADSNEKDNQIARATTNIIIDTINSSPIAERKRLLIVDDEPDITSVLRRGLEQYGFAVDTFNDAVETLSHFKVGYYDLLLLDISMPKMNGFELYNEMAKIDNKVKVCFMTAFEMYRDEFKRLFPKLSLNCFANKPISIKTLANLLKMELEVIATWLAW